MNVFKSIVNFLKGGNHAGGVEIRVPGRHGRDCRVLHKVSAVCEHALSDFGSIRMLASACADERGRDTGALSSDPVCRQKLEMLFERLMNDRTQKIYICLARAGVAAMGNLCVWTDCAEVEV